MSWTSQAEYLADTTDLGASAAMMCGQCRATGLDWKSFRGLVSACLCLGMTPCPAACSIAWPSDTAAVDALLELLERVRGHRRRVDQWITSARRRGAFLRRRVGDGRYDHDAIFAELNDLRAAMEVISPMPARMSTALAGLESTPVQMGETYAAVYRLLEAGHRMPVNGRWLTGELPSVEPASPPGGSS